MGLKILFLSHKFYPDIGGIEVNSEILAIAFHNAGHTVRLLTWSEDYTQKEFPFAITRKPSLRDIWQLNQWADVIFHNNPCLRLGWPTILLRKPTVIALCTLIRRSNGKVHIIDRLKFKYLGTARSVIAVSEAIRQKCWPKAKVIPNPYRVELFKKDDTPMEKTGFVFVGRLVSQKGVDLALKTFKDLMTFDGLMSFNRQSGFSLTIIGDGPDRKKLEELSDELGLGGRVTFTGALRGNSLVSCLNRHKYILVPSRCEEAFGNVALEGMACGCIPIVSDAGGLPDAVGHAGMVFRSGDQADLSASIKALLKDESLELAIQKAAAVHLENHHPDRIAHRYLEVIENAGS